MRMYVPAILRYIVLVRPVRLLAGYLVGSFISGDGTRVYSALPTRNWCIRSDDTCTQIAARPRSPIEERDREGSRFNRSDRKSR